MSIRTDLALESAQAVAATAAATVSGIRQNQYQRANCTITEIRVDNNEAAMKIGKPIGKYITIETNTKGDFDVYPENLDEQVELLGHEISHLLPKKGLVLIIGLGNNDITPDALGPLVAKQIFATRHIKQNLPDCDEFSDLRNVAALAPGVLGQTGIEVAEVTKAICNRIKPSAVIVIDALACSEISRLGRTIQISDTGICPGSGVHNSRKELSKTTLGTEVIAIGVPTVVDMQTIAETISGKDIDTTKYKEMMVTPRSVDKLIERTAYLISLGINKALQPDMTIEDINSLV